MKRICFKSSLVLAASLFAASLHAQQKQTTTGTVSMQHMQYTINNETGKELMSVHKDGRQWELEFVNDKLTALKIDGAEVPKEKWGEYETFIKEMREQLKRDREQAEKDRAQAAKDRVQAEKDREQARLDRIQAEKDRVQAGKDLIQAEKDRAQANLDRIQAEKDRQQGMKDRERADLDRVQAEKDRQQGVKDRAQADLDRVQAEKDRAQADKDREQAKLDRIQAEKDRARAEEDRKILAALTSDLVSDKLVADAKELYELKLNKNEMLVNGLKQPENITKKYQEKYSRFANSGMTYRINGTSRQFSTAE